MANSTFATKHGFQSFPHYTVGRSGAKINKIVIHHAATTNFDVMPGCWQTRQASAHYGIGKAGEIRAYVDEDNTAWHAGNWDANITSIGIEHTNATGDPAWNIAQATIDASSKLCADIAKRHGLGQLVPYKNLYPHSQFTATSCPGVLKNKLQEIADKANALNAPPAPTQTTTQIMEEEEMKLIKVQGKNEVYSLYAGKLTHVLNPDRLTAIYRVWAGAGKSLPIDTISQAEFDRLKEHLNYASVK